MSLRTGRRITQRAWTSLPMPDEVIDRVNTLGKSEGQPELLTFYDCRGLIIGDSQNPDKIEPEQDNFDNYDNEADGLGAYHCQ